MARGKRPVSFRTRKLSLSAPMVLPRGRGGRVGRRRTTIPEGAPASVLGPLRHARPRGRRPRTLTDFVHELSGTSSTNSRGLRPRTLADFVHELSRTSSTNSRGLRPQTLADFVHKVPG